MSRQSASGVGILFKFQLPPLKYIYAVHEYRENVFIEIFYCWLRPKKNNTEMLNC